MKEQQDLLDRQEGFPTEEELAAINEMTVRPLDAKEVFVFSVTLCDNEIDRDYQRFTIPALETLAELFLGRTGIFDHDPRAVNQAARIFRTELKSDPGRTTEAGESYHWLTARAYMLRSESTEGLIREIMAGIKKEVSVGVQVGRITCSICGSNWKEHDCGHRPGEWIDEKFCHQLLEDPTDAYEWSFVAVPAQKAAGVTKVFQSGLREGDLVRALEGSKGAITLSRGDVDKICRHIRSLEREADAGRIYLDRLRKEVIRLAYTAAPELSGEILASVTGKMDADELLAFRRTFAKHAGALKPMAPQLLSDEGIDPEDMTFASYKI